MVISDLVDLVDLPCVWGGLLIRSCHYGRFLAFLPVAGIRLK